MFHFFVHPVQKNRLKVTETPNDGNEKITIDTKNCLETHCIGHGLKFVVILFEATKTQILLIL